MYGGVRSAGFQSYSQVQLAIAWTLSAIASFASAALACRRGRRHGFDAKRLWLWTALGFILGPFGLLLMRSLIESPAREPCSSCGRLRVVTRNRCEYCGGAFPAPAADGTEIFEPA